jgi:hypothetical protein
MITPAMPKVESMLPLLSNRVNCEFLVAVPADEYLAVSLDRKR